MRHIRSTHSRSDAGRRGRRAVGLSVVAAVIAALLGVAPAQAADGSTITGRMVRADGAAWNGEPWHVAALPVDGQGAVRESDVAADGTYHLDDVPAGRYRVRAVPAEEHSGVPAMWHGDTLRESDAAVVEVSAGTTVEGVEVTRFDGETVPHRAAASRTPVVVGTPQVGRTLTVDPQEWTIEDDWFGLPMPVDPSDLTYQWLANGRPVAGATAKTFTPTVAQLGRSLSVRVGVDWPNTTTSNDTSAATQPVTQGRNAPCSSVGLSGHARVGDTLVATRSLCRTAPDTSVRHSQLLDGRRVATTTQPQLPAVGVPR